MEIIVQNKSFEELFRVDEFLTDDCVYMPIIRAGELEHDQGRVYYFDGFLFCESTESQDFFIMKINKTADQFTQEECDYIRESKGLTCNEGVNAIDAYVTGFKNKSPFTLIYDSADGSYKSKEDMVKAVDILQSFVIDNAVTQVEVSFEHQMLKIRDIKE